MIRNKEYFCVFIAGTRKRKMSSPMSPRTPRTPRERTNVRSSSREQKSPTNMKPSRDRTKRSEALIEEQVCKSLNIYNKSLESG